MNESDLILDEFLIEAGEIFDQLDLDFVALEKNTTDRKRIGSIFRAMHSLKGSSRFCAFRRLEHLTHHAESLLGEVREGAIALNAEMVGTLLRVSDRLRDLIDAIKINRVEPEGEDPDLIAELERLTVGGTPAESDDGAVAGGFTHPAPQATRVPATADEPFAPPQALPASDAFQAFTPDRLATASSLAPAVQADPSPPEPAALAPARGAEGPLPVRVSVELLDTLMDLVGEMVLARNRLLTFGERHADQQFTGTVRAIDSITVALQERMMKTRLQPLNQLWSKFPRLVRDVATECGKQVELLQSGGETELDRALIEGVRDPLMHILRNCIDHGIEPAAVRAQRGKPAHGTLSLSASHVNGSVVIEVADDGGGIDIGLVGRKALEKGLVTGERLARLSEREVLDLIFVPGFSTRDQVTTVSGRGVGMDVVRNNLHKIGGSIDIATSSAGTRFSLKIPLTLAIMPALLVRCGSQRFAIPQISLFELVQQVPRAGQPSFERYHDVPVFRLRDELVPLVLLGEQLGLPCAPLDAAAALHVVVVQAAEQRIGLVVDEVLAIQEVVVKPVSGVVRQLGVFSGATVLGDGQVSLILDVSGVAQRARLLDPSAVAGASERRNRSGDVDCEERVPMLLVDLDCVERVAIPLDYVDRLEMVDGSRVEYRGREDVVVLDDTIMPLIWVSSFVDELPSRIVAPGHTLPVVVHRIHDQPIGLVVSRIHDIVHVPPMVTLVSPALRGFVGSAIVAGKAVSILDVPGILRAKGLDMPLAVR